MNKFEIGGESCCGGAATLKCRDDLAAVRITAAVDSVGSAGAGVFDREGTRHARRLPADAECARERVQPAQQPRARDERRSGRGGGGARFVAPKTARDAVFRRGRACAEISAE